MSRISRRGFLAMVPPLAAVRYLIDQNADPSSGLFRRLDLTKVAAAGHSQGAGGAVNTATAAGLVTTAVTISPPAPQWVTPDKSFQVERLTCPTLLVSGT